jgi:choline kinase
MERTNVVVLAAGRGTRLRELGEERQKWLLEVEGVRIADRQLTAVERSAARAPGAVHVHVVTGHAAAGIERFVRERASALTVQLVPNPEYARLNNWYSLLVALHALAPEPPGRLVVFNSDLCADPAWFEAFLCAAAATGEETLIGVDTGRAVTDESMKVSLRDPGADGPGHLGLIGKAGVADAVGEYVGMFMARGHALDALRRALEAFVDDPGARDRWYEDAIGRSAAAGTPWVIWPTPDSRWVEIDDARDHAAARRALAGG